MLQWQTVARCRGASPVNSGRSLPLLFRHAGIDPAYRYSLEAREKAGRDQAYRRGRGDEGGCGGLKEARAAIFDPPHPTSLNLTAFGKALYPSPPWGEGRGAYG